MNVTLDLINQYPLLNRLSEKQRHRLVREASLVTVEEGQIVCAEDIQAARLLFLVRGDIVLSPRCGTSQVIAAGGVRAAMPIVDDRPCPFTVSARTSCTLLYVDTRELQTGSNASPPAGGYEVEEIEVNDGKAWMCLLLRAKAFRRISSHNIQTLINSSTEISVRAGDHVVRQGEPATHYYLVKAGRFRVTRQVIPAGQETELAVLEAGSAFGEDALISHGRRGASVVALEAGIVIRLSKQDFTNLVVNPVLQPISPQEALSRSACGATLVDVRSPDHHRSNGLPSSINIPLTDLRDHALGLDRRREWVVYCDNGNLSAAAAFVLGEYGLRTYLLAGGLSGLARRSAAANVVNN